LSEVEMMPWRYLRKKGFPGQHPTGMTTGRGSSRPGITTRTVSPEVLYGGVMSLKMSGSWPPVWTR